MSREPRDSDSDYDAWKCDDIAPRAMIPRARDLMPASVIAAEVERQAAPPRVEPTPEERRAQGDAWMDRLRAAAGRQLFSDTRRR